MARPCCLPVTGWRPHAARAWVTLTMAGLGAMAVPVKTARSLAAEVGAPLPRGPEAAPYTVNVTTSAGVGLEVTMLPPAISCRMPRSALTAILREAEERRLWAADGGGEAGSGVVPPPPGAANLQQLAAVLVGDGVAAPASGGRRDDDTVPDPVGLVWLAPGDHVCPYPAFLQRSSARHSRIQCAVAVYATLLDVARAIQRVHACGGVHGQVRLSQVEFSVTGGGTALLRGGGCPLFRRYASMAQMDSPASAAAVWCQLPYVAPELLRHYPGSAVWQSAAPAPSDLTPQVDAFAFGTLVHAVTVGQGAALAQEALASDAGMRAGYHEWRLGQWMETVAAVRSQWTAAWPLSLRELVVSCWAENPSHRPSMDAIVATLHALVVDTMPLLHAPMLATTPPAAAALPVAVGGSSEANRVAGGLGATASTEGAGAGYGSDEDDPSPACLAHGGAHPLPARTLPAAAAMSAPPSPLPSCGGASSATPAAVGGSGTLCMSAPLSSPRLDVNGVHTLKEALLARLLMSPSDADACVALADIIHPDETLFLYDGQQVDKRSLLVDALFHNPAHAAAHVLLAMITPPGSTVTLSDGQEWTRQGLLLAGLRLDPRQAAAYVQLSLLLRQQELSHLVPRAKGRGSGPVMEAGRRPPPPTITLPNGVELTSRQLLFEALRVGGRDAEAYLHLAMGADDPEECIHLPADIPAPGGSTAITPQQACMHALTLAPTYAQAYTFLSGMLGVGDTVMLANGRPWSKAQLLTEALRCDPSFLPTYDALLALMHDGEVTEVTGPDGTPHGVQALLLLLIRHVPTHAPAYCALAACMAPSDIVSVSRPSLDVRPVTMSRRDLYTQALSLDPSMGAAMMGLARELGPLDTHTLARGMVVDRVHLLLDALTTDLPTPVVYTQLAAMLTDDAPITLPTGSHMTRLELCQQAILDDPSLLQAYHTLATLIPPGSTVELLDGRIMAQDQLAAMSHTTPAPAV